MSSNAFIEQAEQNINLLLSEKKFREAYQKCDALLLQFPTESSIVDLKRRVESDVIIENKRVIDLKLEGLESLWNSKDYVTILRSLRELLKLDPKSSKLISLYTKAQKLYAEQVEVLEREFEQSQKKKLQELFETSPDALLDELFLLDRNNTGNPSVHRMTTLFRDMLIKKRIDEMAELVYSDKYAAIANFIAELKKIDASNSRIVELESMLRHWQNDEQFNQKSEFIYNGRQHLDTLMKLKKYDKAMRVAEEILRIDANDKFVRKILKNAEQKFFSQTRNLTINSIQAAQPELLTQYQSDKANFIRL